MLSSKPSGCALNARQTPLLVVIIRQLRSDSVIWEESDSVLPFRRTLVSVSWRQRNSDEVSGEREHECRPW
jgi:hypothetical protein